MRTGDFIVGLALAGLFASGISAQVETRRGALGGGVAGAVIGGIIGHQNGETTEGALIGGAVGALAGGFLGAERDEQNWRAYQYQQQQTVRYQQAVSFQDVIMMSQSGVSPHVIIGQIQANGVQRRPGVHDVIGLHQQGVNETVIDAMQRARLSTESYPVVQQRPVIVEHYYEPAPVIVYPAPPPRVHYHYGHHWHW
jgi:Glycine zipper